MAALGEPAPAPPPAPTWASQVTSPGHWSMVHPHTWQQLSLRKCPCRLWGRELGVLHWEEEQDPAISRVPLAHGLSPLLLGSEARGGPECILLECRLQGRGPSCPGLSLMLPLGYFQDLAPERMPPPCYIPGREASYSPSGSVVKESACNAGDPGSIPGSGRSLGERNGNPLQYSCLENSMDRGAWQATVPGVTKSWT